MREILFRGKRLDNGKQIEGYLVKNKFGPGIVLANSESEAEYIFKKQFFNCNFGWIEEVDNGVSQRRV